jgi:mono/diheme cytochrome c family protein
MNLWEIRLAGAGPARGARDYDALESGTLAEGAGHRAVPRGGERSERGRVMRCFAVIGSLMLTAALVPMPVRGRPQAEPSSNSSGAGRRTYRLYCAVCHGQKGKGDGSLADSLRSRPANLTLLAKGNGGEFPSETVARIIDGREPLAGHGGPDMPVWGDAFMKSEPEAGEEKVEQKILSVVAFLEQLQEK